MSMPEFSYFKLSSNLSPILTIFQQGTAYYQLFAQTTAEE